MGLKEMAEERPDGGARLGKAYGKRSCLYNLHAKRAQRGRNGLQMLNVFIGIAW